VLVFVLCHLRLRFPLLGVAQDSYYGSHYHCYHNSSKQSTNDSPSYNVSCVGCRREIFAAKNNNQQAYCRPSCDGVFNPSDIIKAGLTFIRIQSEFYSYLPVLVSTPWHWHQWCHPVLHSWIGWGVDWTYLHLPSHQHQHQRHSATSILCLPVPSGCLYSSTGTLYFQSANCHWRRWLV